MHQCHKELAHERLEASQAAEALTVAGDDAGLKVASHTASSVDVDGIHGRRRSGVGEVGQEDKQDGDEGEKTHGGEGGRDHGW